MERELSVGEAALEVLQSVPGPNPTAKVEGSTHLIGAADHRIDDVLERRVSKACARRAPEVVVEQPVGERGDRAGGRGSVGVRAQDQPRALEGKHSAEVAK